MADGNIFISYRRGQDSNAAGRLYDRLERQFDRAHLFFHIDSIPLGVDFAEHIDGEVAKCDVQLVVIGPGWLDGIDRLQDPEDFVRIEIEAALKRPEIPVIPVLFEGTEMPSREDLPESLQPLVRRNAIVLTHAQFAQVVDGRLTEALKAALGRAGEPSELDTSSVKLQDISDAKSEAEVTGSLADEEPPQVDDADGSVAARNPGAVSEDPAPGRESPAPASDDFAHSDKAPRSETRDPEGAKDPRCNGERSVKNRNAVLVLVSIVGVLCLAYLLYATAFAPQPGFAKIGDGSCANRLFDFNFHRVFPGRTLDQCLDICREERGCTGITSFETGPRNCYTHTHTIRTYLELTAENTAVCFAKR